MEIKTEPFLCQRCGNIVMLPANKNRKFCPDCAKQRNRDWVRQRYAEEKESHRIKNEALSTVKPPKPPEEKVPGLQQCQKCQYWASDGGNQSERFCHFFLRNGVMRERGDTPDDCRSFEPRKRRKKEEQDNATR